MEKLSKIYKSPRCSKYRRAWTAAKHNPPNMPYVGHFLIKVLGLNSLKNIQENFATSLIKKQSVEIATTLKSLSFNNNYDNLVSKNRRNLINPKCLARRILTAILARVKFSAHQKIANETEKGVWTCRQRYLIRKYFHRWHMSTMVSKIHAQIEEKSKNIDSKRKHIIDIATWLTDCQRIAQGYNYPLNSFTYEFLMKARYREDRENFFISLKLEPSKTI